MRLNERLQGGPWYRRYEAASALVLLTAVAGALDVIAFLFLGGAFVSNQTGTILLLAMNAAGTDTVSNVIAVTSILCFIAGAASSARILPRIGPDDRVPHRTALIVSAEVVLIAVGAFAYTSTADRPLVVAALALAMGLQAALAKRIGVAFLTTGYITGSTTDMAMESPVGDHSFGWWWLGLIPVTAMAIGGVIGAVIASTSVFGALLVVAALTGAAGALISIDHARTVR
jgi:uncharacterized membrane protein YoaK (UPF0700 family)